MHVELKIWFTEQKEKISMIFYISNWKMKYKKHCYIIFKLVYKVTEIDVEGMSCKCGSLWRKNTNPESAKWQLIQTHKKMSLALQYCTRFSNCISQKKFIISFFKLKKWEYKSLPCLVLLLAQWGLDINQKVNR